MTDKQSSDGYNQGKAQKDNLLRNILIGIILFGILAVVGLLAILAYFTSV